MRKKIHVYVTMTHAADIGTIEASSQEEAEEKAKALLEEFTSATPHRSTADLEWFAPDNAECKVDLNDLYHTQ